MAEDDSTHPNKTGNNNTIALVCSEGLGDGLLQLVFARNLTNNGYRVTFFNNHVAQLDSLIKGITIKPHPEPNTIFNTLDQFDLTLFDSGNPQLKKLSPQEQDYLGKNYICYSISKSQPRIIHDYESLLKNKLPSQNHHSLMRFSECNRCIRNKKRKAFTIPEHIAWFCHKHLSLSDTTTFNNLQKPESTFRKYDKRVIIHPTSRNSKKNWKQSYFLALARQLKIDGWQPIFSVAPVKH